MYQQQFLVSQDIGVDTVLGSDWLGICKLLCDEDWVRFPVSSPEYCATMHLNQPGVLATVVVCCTTLLRCPGRSTSIMFDSTLFHTCTIAWYSQLETRKLTWPLLQKNVRLQRDIHITFNTKQVRKARSILYLEIQCDAYEGMPW
jgi:hypothetical protein